MRVSKRELIDLVRDAYFEGRADGVWQSGANEHGSSCTSDIEGFRASDIKLGLLGVLTRERGDAL